MLVLAGAGIFAAGIATADEVRGMFFNSDTLLPAAYVHDLLWHPDAVSWFQVPRIPSFFPDLAAVLLLSLAIPSWRVVSLCYAALSFTALVALCGCIVAKLAGRAVVASTAMFGALAALAMLLDLQVNGARSAFFYVLLPVIHSGSLIAALGGLLLFKRFLDQPCAVSGVAVAALAVVCTASDRIFVGLFAVPAVVGALTLLLPHRDPASAAARRRVLPALALVAAGCAGGFLLDHLLFTRLMARDPDLPISLQTQMARLPVMIRDPGTQVAVVLAILVVLMPAAWAPRSRDGRFWWAAAAATTAGILALLPLVYIDHTATRYAQPVWWWGLVILAAAVLRAAPAAAPLCATAAAALLVTASALGRPDLFAPAQVTQWRDPVEQCLSKLHGDGVIHAGLAHYWVARPVEASSDWRLQVVQVTDKGWAFRWQTNTSYYATSRGNPLHGPDFDFLVAAGLDLAAVEARYGTPSRVVPCAGTEVWIYDNRQRFRRAIVGADSWRFRDGLLATPAWFGPADLFTHGGPLPPNGVVPGVASATPAVATWGPYVALHPGAWRITLQYRLASKAAGRTRWEIAVGLSGPVLARGALASGDQTTVQAFDWPGNPGLMELRTFIAAGDQLQVLGFSLCPATASEASCRPEALGLAGDAGQQ